MTQAGSVDIESVAQHVLTETKSLPKDPEDLRAVSELLMAEVKSQAYQIEKRKAELAGHRKARFWHAKSSDRRKL